MSRAAGRASLLLLFLLLFLLLPLGGCPAPAPDPRGSSTPGEDPQAYSERRAWDHLRQLCALGPRGHDTPGWRKARELISAHLRTCGVEPVERAFEFETAQSPLVNITARFPGQRDDVWILIGTHYDTRLWADEDDEGLRHVAIEGANDGGSGTAVLLELARVLSQRTPAVGVELVFFDGEDFGRRGSKDYMLGSKDMASRFGELYPTRPAAAIVLDMVGDLDLRFLREATADDDHPWLNDMIWEAAHERGYSEDFPAEGSLRVWDDHTALLDAGIPATCLIDFTYPFWHTVDDTLDKCSPRSLRVTGEVLLATIERPELLEPR